MTSLPASALVERARAVLQANLVVTADGHRYIRPAPMTYEHQWLWDSCFHAIVNTQLDPGLAMDEIAALLGGQVRDGPDAGMLPHMIYWQGGGRELWGHDERSTITQPPVVAYAVERISGATNDISFVRRVYPALKAYHEWWLRRRDADDDGLVSTIHPWEAGWDASPKWDQLMGLSPHPTDAEARQARMTLVPQLAALDYDLERIQAAGLYNVESCDLNALYVRSLHSLIKLAALLGADNDAHHFKQVAERTAAALQARCWDEALGIYVDLAGVEETPLSVRTPAIFVPLFAGVPTATQARRLVERLTSPAEFWPAYPVPCVALDEPEFSTERYWRGPAWPHLNWMITLGLRRYGYDTLAAELTRRTVNLIDRQGFWEFYNPLTGAGLGAHPQSWTTLVLDMLAGAASAPALSAST